MRALLADQQEGSSSRWTSAVGGLQSVTLVLLPFGASTGQTRTLDPLACWSLLRHFFRRRPTRNLPKEKAPNQVSHVVASSTLPDVNGHQEGADPEF